MPYVAQSHRSKITLLRNLNESEVKDRPPEMLDYASVFFHRHLWPCPSTQMRDSGAIKHLRRMSQPKHYFSLQPNKDWHSGGGGRLLFFSTSWVTKLPKQLWMVKGNFMFDNIYCTFTSTWYNMVQQMAEQGLSKSPPFKYEISIRMWSIWDETKKCMESSTFKSYKGLFELFKKGSALCTSCWWTSSLKYVHLKMLRPLFIIISNCVFCYWTRSVLAFQAMLRYFCGLYPNMAKSTLKR